MFLGLLIAICAILVLKVLVVGVVGYGLDRTGELPPQQRRGYVNPAGLHRGNIGGHGSSIVATAATKTRIFRSEFIPFDTLGRHFNFLLDLAGIVGSDGTDDATITIEAVEPDGTAVTLATITTVSLANEDDKAFFIRALGRVTLEQVGATSGKIFVAALMEALQGTPLRFHGASAEAGAAVDFRNGFYIDVNVAWDDTDATTRISNVAAMMSVNNTVGGEG